MHELRLPQYRYLELLKILIVLLNYLPYLFFLEMGVRAWVMIGGGLYLALALSVRNVVLAGRLPVWVRLAWILADAVIWVWVQRVNGWDGNYAYLVLALDAALAAWRRYYGLPWLMAAALITVGAQALHRDTVRQFISLDLFPAAVGLLLVHAFIYMTVRIRRDAEEMAALRERNRLAREVHDTIAHGFTGMIMQMEAVQLQLAADPVAASQRLSRLQQAARANLDELRRSVHALRPRQLEQQDGAAALARLVADCRDHGLPAEFASHGRPFPLPPAHEHCLYRAAQEAIANAIRHGSASRAWVHLAYEPGAVQLSITDDGRGVVGGGDPSGSGGAGLAGLRERAAALGGTCEASGQPGQGFRVVVRLPVPA